MTAPDYEAMRRDAERASQPHVGYGARRQAKAVLTLLNRVRELETALATIRDIEARGDIIDVMRATARAALGRDE